MKSFICLLIALNMTAAGLFPQVPTDGLLASYSFNGNAVDGSGNGNTASVHHATLTADRFGNTNSAYYFNGADSHIVIDYQFGNRYESEYTVSMWVKANDTQDRYGKLLCMPQSLDSWEYPYHYLAIGYGNQSEGVQEFTSSYYNSTEFAGTVYTTSVIPDTWQHLVFVFQSGQATQYVNNVIRSTGSLSETQLYFPEHGFSIGSRNINADVNGEFFHGSIDDIHIYNRALGPAEVSSLFNNNEVFVDVLVHQTYIDRAANSMATFEICSNTDWAVSCPESWLTIDQNSGSGNATIEMSASENTSATTRSAFVKVTGTGVPDRIISFTQNGFARWQPLNSGIHRGSIRDITVDTTNGFMYLATRGSGIFLSADHGSTWSPVNNGISNLHINDVATGEGYILAGTSDGVSVSYDQGRNWTQINNGLTGDALGVASVAISGEYLFAGTNGAGVYVSSDHGSNWTPVNDGLSNLNIYALEAKKDTIIAGTGHGVYISEDNGRNWIDKNYGMYPENLRIHSLAVHGNDIFAGTGEGLYLSRDNGDLWMHLYNGLPSYGDLNMYSIAVHGNTVCAGTGSAIYLSTDYGVNWTTVNEGIMSQWVFALRMCGDTIFAGTQEGLLISSDYGNSWSELDNGISGKSLSVNSVATVEDTVVAATDQGVFVSRNNGQTWSGPYSEVSGEVRTVAVNGDFIFAGTTSGQGIYRSDDNGNSWIPVNNGLVSFYQRKIYSIACKGNMMFAGTQDGTFLSTDYGDTWEAVNTGLGNTWVIAVGVHENRIYAGTWGGGMYVSSDNGNSWTAINNGLSGKGLWIQTISTNSDGIYIGTSGAGVYFSPDNGNNWMSLNRGLPGNGPDILSLACSDENLFAGIGQVYLSTNKGMDWTPVDNGLSGSSYGALALALKETEVFVGTSAAGIWKNTLAEIRNLSVSENEISIAAPANSTADFQIETFTHWEVNSDQKWLAMSENAGAGNATITMRAAANPTTSSRTANVDVTRDGTILATIRVEQEGAIPTLDLSKDTIRISSEGNSTRLLFVNSTTSWTLTSNRNWLVADPDSTSGNEFVNLNASENNSGLRRIAIVNLSGPDLPEKNVTVIQDRKGQWQHISKGTDISRITALAIHPTTGFLYATTNKEGVSLSYDNGDTWESMNTGLPVFDPWDPIAYNAIITRGNNIFLGTEQGIYRSGFFGHTWMQVNHGLQENSLDVRALAVSGDTIYAGTAEGIYISDNNGHSWLPVNNGLTEYSMNIKSLAISGNCILAGTADGIYKSANRGYSWTEANEGLPEFRPEIQVFAVFEEGIIAATSDGVYKTDNQGESWYPANEGLSDYNNYVYSLVCSRSSIIAGTYDGIYRSDDYGGNWSRVSSYSPLDELRVRSLTVSDDHVYAGTTNGVYYSGNNGTSWEATQGCISPTNAQQLIAAGNRLFCVSDHRLYLSQDLGNSWKTFDDDISDTKVYSMEVNEERLFAGTDEGVYVYSFADSSWNRESSGLTYDPITSMLFQGNLLYTGSEEGVFVSINNGDSWTAVNNGLWSLDVHSLAGSEDKLFAGTKDGVFVSEDNGNNWNLATSGLLNTRILTLETEGGKVYAGTEDGVYFSNDDGKNWIPISQGLQPGTHVLSIASDNKEIFIGSGGSGIYYSDNAGGNWSSVNDGLLYPTVQTILLDSVNIYIGTRKGGIWKKKQSENTISSFHEKSNTHYTLVYPNPAHDYIIVRSTQEMLSLTVTSIEGKRLIQEEVFSKWHELDITHLPDGIYLLETSKENQKEQIQFIKY